MMIDTHALIKKIVALGVDEKKAEFAVNNFVSQEQLEQSVIKLSEFKEAINSLQTNITKLDHKIEASIIMLDHKLEKSIGKLEKSIEILKSEIGHLKWSIPLYFGVAIAILKYFK